MDDGGAGGADDGAGVISGSNGEQAGGETEPDSAWDWAGPQSWQPGQCEHSAEC